MPLTHCDPCLKIQVPSCQSMIYLPIAWNGGAFTLMINNATENMFVYNGIGNQFIIDPAVLPAGWYDSTQTWFIQLYDANGNQDEFTYNGHNYNCIWLTFGGFGGSTQVIITDENGNNFITENDILIAP